VHTYGTNQAAVARHQHRRRGTPFVLTAHFHPIWSIEGGWLRHRLRGFYDRRVASTVIRDASRIIVQTHEEERLLRSLGFPLPPLEVIPPGYRPLPPPPTGSASFAERFHVPGPFVLFVGRLASNKGLLDLAEAFGSLARSDRSAQLVVVGEDGGQRGLLVAKVRELGLSERVHLLGHVDEDTLLSAAYREARVTVLPSEYEAFGLVLLESLAAGTPVVASRVGGIPEVVEDGKAGLLVPPKSPPALAEAIRRVWEDRDLARRLGEYGRDQVVPRFRWDTLADRLDALYREVTRR
jgi:rhamnosyl/mannosyltransferase